MADSPIQPVVATPAFCSVGPGDSRDIALEWVHDEECGRETEVSFLFGDLRLLEMADIGTGTSNGERYARALRDYFLGGDEEGKADATKVTAAPFEKALCASLTRVTRRTWTGWH